MNYEWENSKRRGAKTQRKLGIKNHELGIGGRRSFLCASVSLRLKNLWGKAKHVYLVKNRVDHPDENC
jgi:hypothetical protein